MKQFLLPEQGRFYKANLHCHTTCSDGELTPEEIRTVYKEKGYSVVAYTDHEVLFPHDDLRQEDFLPLNAVELDAGHPDEWDASQRFHICCIALEPDNVVTPCFSPEWSKLFRIAQRDQAKAPAGRPVLSRVHTAENCNALIAEAKELGFYVTYNHPDWSLEQQEDFCSYTGMDAMEIYNHGCVVDGYQDYNPKDYDFLLRQGKRIHAIAADDNHNRMPRNTTGWDSCGGWVMIKADALEYRTITAALQAGNFYASTGPEIRELWFEDGKVHVECGPAEKIYLTTARRSRQMRWAPEGESLTQAEFDVVPEDGFIRITVVDHRGRTADTNAYFLDKLF